MRGQFMSQILNVALGVLCALAIFARHQSFVFTQGYSAKSMIIISSGGRMIIGNEPSNRFTGFTSTKYIPWQLSGEQSIRRHRVFRIEYESRYVPGLHIWRLSVPYLWIISLLAMLPAYRLIHFLLAVAGLHHPMGPQARDGKQGFGVVEPHEAAPITGDLKNELIREDRRAVLVALICQLMFPSALIGSLAVLFVSFRPASSEVRSNQMSDAQLLRHDLEARIRDSHQDDRSAYLGLAVSDVALDSTYSTHTGVKVDLVLDGSPASVAGFEEGDIISAIDGIPVRSADEFVQMIKGYAPNTKVKIVVTRKNSSPMEVLVTLTSLNDKSASPR